jgi:hypothetical protein
MIPWPSFQPIQLGFYRRAGGFEQIHETSVSGEIRVSRTKAREVAGGLQAFGLFGFSQVLLIHEILWEHSMSLSCHLKSQNKLVTLQLGYSDEEAIRFSAKHNNAIAIKGHRLRDDEEHIKDIPYQDAFGDLPAVTLYVVVYEWIGPERGTPGVPRGTCCGGTASSSA